MQVTNKETRLLMQIQIVSGRRERSFRGASMGGSGSRCYTQTDEVKLWPNGIAGILTPRQTTVRRLRAMPPPDTRPSSN